MEFFCVKKERFWTGALIAFLALCFFGRMEPASL